MELNSWNIDLHSAYHKWLRIERRNDKNKLIQEYKYSLEQLIGHMGIIRFFKETMDSPELIEEYVFVDEFIWKLSKRLVSDVSDLYYM